MSRVKILSNSRHQTYIRVARPEYYTRFINNLEVEKRRCLDKPKYPGCSRGAELEFGRSRNSSPTGAAVVCRKDSV